MLGSIEPRFEVPGPAGAGVGEPDLGIIPLETPAPHEAPAPHDEPVLQFEFETGVAHAELYIGRQLGTEVRHRERRWNNRQANAESTTNSMISDHIKVTRKIGFSFRQVCFIAVSPRMLDGFIGLDFNALAASMLRRATLCCNKRMLWNGSASSFGGYARTKDQVIRTNRSHSKPTHCNGWDPR